MYKNIIICSFPTDIPLFLRPINVVFFSHKHHNIEKWKLFFLSSNITSLKNIHVYFWVKHRALFKKVTPLYRQVFKKKAEKFQSIWILRGTKLLDSPRRAHVSRRWELFQSSAKSWSPWWILIELYIPVTVVTCFWLYTKLKCTCNEFTKII